jgi:phosphoenolpyruvate carboxykinase (ATP)
VPWNPVDWRLASARAVDGAESFPSSSTAFPAAGPARRPQPTRAQLNHPLAARWGRGPGEEATRRKRRGQSRPLQPRHGADTFGFRNLKRVRWNLGAPALYEHAIAANEAQIVHGGALLADTGVHTGRSPKDKFTVRDATTENTVWWDNNKAMSREHFDTLLADFIAHAEGKELFAQDLYGGADPNYRIKARVYTELAWHSLFIRNLLIRPEVSELTSYIPDMTVVDLPSFKADPARHGCRTETVIACDFTRRIVLIGGTSYAGEMKKSVFTFLNFICRGLKVLPMHCSANLGERATCAVLRPLRHRHDHALGRSEPHVDGDDEHGWGPGGVFNFEGVLLRQDDPPVPRGRARDLRHHERFGTVLEKRGAWDPSRGSRLRRRVDGPRTRACAYPLDFISNASPTAAPACRRTL